MNLLLNRYDNEYIGFLNEIGNRLKYFDSETNLRIRSWIKLLSLQYTTKEEKQNRNLYAIKLINQMINGKIKYPFNNYANINELKPLLAIDIKSELTQKFYEEINIEKIVKYGYEMQNKFLSSNPQYYNTFQNSSNLIRNSNFTNSIDFNDNKFYLSSRNEDNSYDTYEININNNNNYINNYDIDMNDEDNEKLYQIIERLQKRIKEEDKIIEFQKNEIDKLNNILNTLNIQFNINDSNT